MTNYIGHTAFGRLGRAGTLEAVIEIAPTNNTDDVSVVKATTGKYTEQGGMRDGSEHKKADALLKAIDQAGFELNIDDADLFVPTPFTREQAAILSEVVSLKKKETK